MHSLFESRLCGARRSTAASRVCPHRDAAPTTRSTAPVARTAAASRTVRTRTGWKRRGSVGRDVASYMQASAHGGRPSASLRPARRVWLSPARAVTDPSRQGSPSLLPAAPANAPPPREGRGVYVASDASLYVDGVSAAELRSWAEARGGRKGAPLYVYSRAQLDANYKAYDDALQGIPHVVGYAIKANPSLRIAKRARELGAGAVLVSGAELDLAVLAGFDPSKCVFNGNGKTAAELEKAVRLGALVNVDSEFDAGHLAEAARAVGKRARALLRINPEVDARVHPYVSTGIAGSKFGIRNTHLDWFLEWARENRDAVELVGVHSHLGSTIAEVGVFRDATAIMMRFVERIREAGFPISYLNIGGGLGIDYRRGSDGQDATLPAPRDLVGAIRDLVADKGLTLILEPGRSFVGNAGALLATVIGVKSSTAKNFVVVDASMAELLRPALYGAYQHIVPFSDDGPGAPATFDVVGTVCESSDFLGKGRRLRTPAPGDGLAVLDAGAYCMAMASNYNLRMRPQELWVTGDGGVVESIRRAETFDDYLRCFDV